MNVAPTLVLATVLPGSIFATRWFVVLSTFVAINTMLYVSMSLFNVLPKLYLSDVVRRYGRRAETRSIYPDGHSASDPAIEQPWVLRASARPPWPGQVLAGERSTSSRHREIGYSR